MKCKALQALAARAALAVAVTLGAAAGGPLHAQAQDALKIGYVNSERVLRESNVARAALAKLQSEFGKREKDLEDTRVRLKATADRLDKEGPTLAEAERGKRQRELVEQDREYQRRSREFQEDLNLRRNEELARVVERANKVIKSIAEAERFDLILQEVLHAGPRVDITDKVIRDLDSAAGSGR